MSLPHSEDPMAHALRGLIRAVVKEVLAETTHTGPTHYSTDALPPGVSSRAFITAIHKGALPAAKVGKRWVVTRADVDAWLASRTSTRAVSQPADDVAAVLRANGLQPTRRSR